MKKDGNQRLSGKEWEVSQGVGESGVRRKESPNVKGSQRIKPRSFEWGNEFRLWKSVERCVVEVVLSCLRVLLWCVWLDLEC